MRAAPAPICKHFENKGRMTAFTLPSSKKEIKTLTNYEKNDTMRPAMVSGTCDLTGL